MKNLHVLGAAAFGCLSALSACQPLPAHAFNVPTAAWATANTICQAMDAGLNIGLLLKASQRGLQL